MSYTKKDILLWLLRIIAAGIMLQTLYFKFSGAAESRFIFSTVGIEPWGRIGTGILELIASILLFIPKTTWLGALTGFGLMSGAILMHFTILGIEVQEDGGLLFIYACITWACCLVLGLQYRDHFVALFQQLKNRT
jgi:uncharacterized membrane protein YphA (DoxX/SURF4 family)